MIEGDVSGLAVAMVALWLVIFTSVAAAIRVNRSSVRSGVTRQCPHCLETIHRAATICRFCRREVEPMRLHDGRWWTTDDTGRPVWLDENTWTWHLVEDAPEAEPTNT